MKSLRYRNFIFPLLPLSFIAILGSSCFDFTTDPQGTIVSAGDTTTINDVKIVYLYGTHFERGVQHGYLLAEGVQSVLHDFLIAHLFENNAARYAYARSFLSKHFRYEKEFEDEARGVVEGMRKAGIPLYDSTLGREFDSFDILLLSSLEELFNIVNLNFGCSSISSWGQATREDPLLKGELVITRHWDYPRFDPMIQNLALFVHSPSEADEQKWASVGWAGAISSATAMNESGIGAFLNYGPEFEGDAASPSLHRPVCFSLRKGIEKDDYNTDGRETIKDALKALQEFHPYFSSIVHVVSSVQNDTNALIIESGNQKGILYRTIFDNDSIPGDNLAATNHFRKLYDPITCRRYNNIMDSLAHSNSMTLERSPALLAGAGAYQNCIYSITYVPAWGKINLAVTTIEEPVPAYQRPGLNTSFTNLFSHK
jgi:hypothetical protein